MTRVVIRSEIFTDGDLDNVPLAKFREVVRSLQRHPDLGKPLARELVGCRSVRVEGSQKRLVHRQYRVGDETVVEIIALEARRANEVYDQATRRVL